LIHGTAFHLWITAIDNSYEASIVSKLIERGYAIACADGKTTSIQTENGFSVLIALKVERFSGKSFTAQELHNDTMAILKEVDGKHYSVIVAPYSQNTIWCASNVGIPVMKTTNGLN
jgi:hypothetical protein